MTDLNDPIKPMRPARPRRSSAVTSNDLLKIATGLTDSMNGLGQEISHLAQSQKRSNRIIHGVIASLIFDITLSVGLIFAGISSNHASHVAHALAQQNKEQLYINCTTGNATKVKEIAIWTAFYSTPHSEAVHGLPSNNPSLLFVKKTFAPRVCGQDPNK
jgi:hypothetical protein